MKLMKTFFKLTTIIILWIVCYIVLLPKLNYSAITGKSYTPYICVHVFPMFAIGILLNIDHLVACIRQKDRLNKKMLVLFLVFLATLSIVFIESISSDILLRQTSITSYSRGGLLVRLNMYISTARLYLVIALCCGYLITCLFDKNTLRHLLKTIVIIAIWGFFYIILLPQVKSSSARQFMINPFTYGFVHVFPFFAAGFLLHIEDMITAIKQKNPLNKAVSGIVILFLIFIGIVFFSDKIPTAITVLTYYLIDVYIVLSLCCGYSITCLFDKY